jgi:hypothetical protein
LLYTLCMLQYLHFLVLLSQAADYLCDRRELLPGDGPDGPGRGSVTGNSSADDLGKNTKRRSLLVVVPNLIWRNLDNSHPWVLGSTSVDTISLVSEPSLDGGVV